MSKFLRTATAFSVSASLFGLMAFSGPAAYADHHHHDVQRSGDCSVSSRWHLELDDMMMMDDIWARFEVQSGTAGQAWKVRLTNNGAVFWRGSRTTNHDGHFDVHDWTHDQGTNKIVGRSVNQSTGEVCRGVATI